MQSVSVDIEFVVRLRKGDTEAFDMLYEKYSIKLYGFGLKYLRSADEAEELVQSVFLKVWKNHKNLKKDLSFKSYLLTIAYNEICNLIRERKYHRKFIDDTLYEYSHPSSAMKDSIDLLSVLDQVNQIINKLPERQSSIFLKRWKECKLTKEIAEEVGLSPGTIDNYISYCLKFIRARLPKENL